MRRLYLVPPALLLLGLLIASCEAEPELPPAPPARVELDPPGPKDPDLAAKAAVILGSCLSGGKDFLNPQSMLIDFYYRVLAAWPFFETLERTTHCLSEAADGCKSLERCVASSSARRTSDTPCKSTCLPGDVATACVGEPIELRTDCARLGMTCEEGGCSPYPVYEPCDPATADPCADNTPRHCPAGYDYAWRGISCSDHGLLCGVVQLGEQPWSLCQGSGAACSESYDFDDIRFFPGLGCEGSQARTCMNYREHVFDCGTLAEGFTCQSAQGLAFCGLASECPLVDTAATCEGDNIVLCNAGRVDRIDCKALGFDGCDPDVGLCYPSPASTR